MVSSACVNPAPRTTSIGSAMMTMRAARGRARQFGRVFDRALVPMVLVDNQRRYVAANAAARLAFRLSLDEILSRRIDDLTPPHMLQTLQEKWERLMRDGAVSGPYDVGFPDGSGLQVVYCALANVFPAQHLIVFVPASWPGDELSLVEESGPERRRGRLSPREREVLSLIAEGASIDQIAEELTISTTTARTHARNALRKLGARNRAHAIALAMRDGLLEVAGTNVDRAASSA